jgi:hypothetical protein
MAGQATTIEDLNGLMRLMMKSALERMLDTEMDVHLGRRPAAAGDSALLATEMPPDSEPTPPLTRPGKRPPNPRNGRSQKTVQGVVWIYYSAQIMFLGAELTQVYARRYGSGMKSDGVDTTPPSAPTMQGLHQSLAKTHG